MKKPLILIIRDGWGYRKSCKDNVLCNANIPNTKRLMKEYPNTLLDASGEAVGLPKGYQGNSEVGHMTIGSGRIIFQSLERINYSINTQEFFKNKAFLGAISNCKKNNSTLHIIGLLQTEGVHSHINHLFALLDLCKKQNFKNVKIHVITDGRDSPVTSSLDKLKKLNSKIKKLGFGEIATVSGRFYAMDRDNRWERTKQAYDCIVKGESPEFKDVIIQVKLNHKNKETDEFIIPRKLKGYDGIHSKDSIIFYNFRTDRTRQLTKSIVEDKFEGWQRKPLDVYYAAMTQYYIPMNAHVAFEDLKLNNLLGDVLAKNNKKQLRISETEKYAHVTFFFNGQIEKPNKGEDRILIYSPKVKTYDLKPEMSVYEITEKLLKEIDKNKYDVIVVNLVNGDMVGHTGIVPACKKAAESVDKCLGKITDKILEKEGTALIFADHGNIEDQTPRWRTSHTINKVPLIVVSNSKMKVKKGGLKDIAPTALKILGIKKPKEMTGVSLV